MTIDWNHITKLTDEYERTAGQVLNVEQFNLFAITHHSTKIEGSTLTQEETNALLEKGTSIGGKPLEHQNMVVDHQEALEWILEQAKKKRPVTVQLLNDIASKVMRRTGKQVNSILGNTDETKGDFRKVNVSAGGFYFVDQSKVISLSTDLVNKITSRIENVKTIEEILTLAFVSHFDLVSIHPFTDGNGRVSRLLMNYIEAYHGQPLTRVHAEDRVEYIESLKLSREQKTTEPIVEFLSKQHQKVLKANIKSFKASQEIKSNSKGQGEGYSMIF
jgi:Fic family protein